MHEEEAEYSAYQARKRSQLSDALSQTSPTKLGGHRLDDSDVAAMRERQERERRLDAKFESIRKRVSRYHQKDELCYYHFRRKESSTLPSKGREKIRCMKQRNRRQENRSIDGITVDVCVSTLC